MLREAEQRELDGGSGHPGRRKTVLISFGKSKLPCRISVNRAGKQQKMKLLRLSGFPDSRFL